MENVQAPKTESKRLFASARSHHEAQPGDGGRRFMPAHSLTYSGNLPEPPLASWNLGRWMRPTDATVLPAMPGSQSSDARLPPARLAITCSMGLSDVISYKVRLPKSH